MKMTDIPALPKIKKPFNRSAYDLAWMPFGLLAGFVGALMSQYKAGFTLSGLIVAVGVVISLMSGGIDLTRAVFFLVAFVGLGLVLTAAISLVTGLSRGFR